MVNNICISNNIHIFVSSDHSLNRCLVYGAGARPLPVTCHVQDNSDTRAIASSNIDEHSFSGMCFMARECKLDQHVTCHRYRAKLQSDFTVVPVRTSKSSGHYRHYSTVRTGNSTESFL
jgi:hypothetical protein